MRKIKGNTEEILARERERGEEVNRKKAVKEEEMQNSLLRREGVLVMLFFRFLLQLIASPLGDVIQGMVFIVKPR